MKRRLNFSPKENKTSDSCNLSKKQKPNQRNEKKEMTEKASVEGIEEELSSTSDIDSKEKIKL